MPSPFPGVDPYIEDQWYWADYRASLLTYCRDTLNELLEDRYEARLDVRHEEEEGFRQAYVKILHLPERSLVTVIEFLSFDNKTGSGRERYLSDRESILRQKVHLVELDLLLRGRRLPILNPLPDGDSFVTISRWHHPERVEVYAWSLRDALPTIAIPLKPPNFGVPLNLGALLSVAYDRGHYTRCINYNAPLTVPLSPDKLLWAAEVVAKGKKD